MRHDAIPRVSRASTPAHVLASTLNLVRLFTKMPCRGLDPKAHYVVVWYAHLIYVLVLPHQSTNLQTDGPYLWLGQPRLVAKSISIKDGFQGKPTPTTCRNAVPVFFDPQTHVNLPCLDRSFSVWPTRLYHIDSAMLERHP